MNAATNGGLRGVVLGLLLLAWWNPPSPWRAAPGDVIILLDDSVSMERVAAAASWSRLAADMARLPAGSRFAVARFAATPVLATPLTGTAQFPAALPPRAQALDRSASDLAAALAFGLRLVDPRRPTVLLLFSDGAETQGQVQPLLQATAAPIYRLTPPLQALNDAWIDDLSAPAVIRAGQRAPVTVTLASAAAGPARLQWRVNGQPQPDYPLQLAAGAAVTAPLLSPPLGSGVNRLDAALTMPGDPFAANDSRTVLINVAGPPSVLYVSAAADEPPVVAALRRGGWPAQALSPQALLQQDLSASGVIVLDDIPVAAMAEPAWSALAEATRRQGAGLIVLGGPHSFGGGGYRHSTLESLSPLLATAATAPTPAAVLFMVDKSGSMAQADNGVSRLALARRAVEATALALPPADRIGLLAFDSEPHMLLPLGHYPQPAPALENAWRFRAGGGTRLQPALRAALAQLQAAPTEQRLLALVTDGFVESDDYSALETQLEAAGVTLIALAVGAANQTILQRLASRHDGRLLPVRELALLPRLLQQEVERRRSSLETGPVIPQQLQPLPFTLSASWPALAAYQVTQARPEAQVYLQAPAGDPLLALWQAGAGRVAALPGGLGDWAPDWRRWPEFGRFLGGLADWVSSRGADRYLQLQVEDSAGALQIQVDALGIEQDWDGSGAATLSLQDPSGRQWEQALTLTAPGRYVAVAPATQTGPYRILARNGDHSVRQDIWREAAGEFQSPAAVERRWADWLRQGLIQPWPDGGLTRLPGAAPARPLRPPLLLLAGLLYIGLLLLERAPPLALLGSRRRRGAR